METNNTSAACTCGNFGCAVRIQRNLTPFCRLAAPVRVEPSNVFGSYVEAAAYARQVGGKVLAGGGYLQGGPRRFSVEAR